MSNLKIRFLIIAAIVLACIYGIIGLPKSKAELVKNWNNNIRLGLDLRGGSNLVLQVQLQDAFKVYADQAMDRLKDDLHKANVEFQSIDRNDPQTLDEAKTIQINIKGVPLNKTAAFRTVINEKYGTTWDMTPVNQTDYRL